MEMIKEMLLRVWELGVEIVPIFVLAVFLASLLEEFLSAKGVERFISGRGIGSVSLSAMTGALIPLCTCGMIPLARALKRKGAGWIPLFSFLTAGVASSIPALILTLVLGWKVTILRLVVAFGFGIVVAYVISSILGTKFSPQEVGSNGEHDHAEDVYCKLCSHREAGHLLCWTRFKEALGLFGGEFMDFFPWLIISLVAAGVIGAVVPRGVIVAILGKERFYSPFIASSIGIPFYFCAGSDVPLVQSLLSKGAGLGSGMAIMTSAPTVNIPAIGIISKWLGKRRMLIYMGVCWLVSGFLGLIINVF